MSLGSAVLIDISRTESLETEDVVRILPVLLVDQRLDLQAMEAF